MFHQLERDTEIDTDPMRKSLAQSAHVIYEGRSRCLFSMPDCLQPQVVKACKELPSPRQKHLGCIKLTFRGINTTEAQRPSSRRILVKKRTAGTVMPYIHRTAPITISGVIATNGRNILLVMKWPARFLRHLLRPRKR